MWSQKRRGAGPPVYDVVIIGSGAAGGTAAWTLVQAGLNVAMLDAGPLRRPMNDEDFIYHDPWPYDDPYRGFKTPLVTPDDITKKFKLEGSTKDEPYTTPEKLPYNWFRARNVGGRTMFWGRFANRFNEDDFKMRSTDGQGLDWPIEYKDIAPYYDKAEIFMGVCGAKENHPDLPDSDNFLPPVAFKCSDVAIKKAAEKTGLRAIHVRRAMLTQNYHGYSHCHYCSGCENGCDTQSFYNSPDRQILPLMKKYPKTFMLIPNAMARKINTNAKGLASSVSFIDKTTGKDREIKASRAVVVACGALESTRLLLMSNIANSSGMIGKNFIEHLDVGAQAYFPELFFVDREAGDGIGGSHIIIPWFGYFRPEEKRDFLRGFQIEPSSRIRMRPDKNAKNIRGFGGEYKKEVRKWTGARVVLASHGEMLPGPNKFVELDPSVMDKWGMPVLKIHHPLVSNDINMYKYIRRTYEEIFAAAKAVDVRLQEADTPGHSIHEMGTAHMGADPKTSVLNQFNQSWDVKNLFVMDAAAFASGTHKNPTLTIMALAWRASEYLMDEMKKQNL
ncbi:MAG: GMC family oxidoreductase [Chloracidobacterium sp.]|nr:GMC family oxidoreductase [Chloracidobacterium sp.]